MKRGLIRSVQHRTGVADGPPAAKRLPTTSIPILCAHGGLARYTTRRLLDQLSAELTLYLRQARRPLTQSGCESSGGVHDHPMLEAVMREQDVAYANLSGEMVGQATALGQAMHGAGCW